MMFLVDTKPPVRGSGVRRWTHIYATAAIWPRSHYVEAGRRGNVAMAKLHKAEDDRDCAQVRKLMLEEPGISAQQVAMRCFMSNNQAARLMKRCVGGDTE